MSWRELLADHLFGLPSGTREAELASAIGESPEARQAAAETEEALAHWAARRIGAVPPAAPRVRERLLATLAGSERFRPFFASLRESYDLDEPALRAVLARVDEPTGWVQAPFPGVTYFHFQPGAAAGMIEAGVVRLAPGAAFPMHRHLGGEITTVLEGVLCDGGRLHHPGAVVTRAAGSTHDYTSVGLRDLVIVSAHGGIEFVV